MSMIKCCDRCGTTYGLYNVDNSSSKANGFMFLNIDVRMKYYTHKAYDLCPECMDSLRNWFKEKGENYHAED